VCRISSRFPNVFTFSDYTVAEMGEISLSIIKEKGFQMADGLNLEVMKTKTSAAVKRHLTHVLFGQAITDIIGSSVRSSEIAKGNGRLARNLVEQVMNSSLCLFE
jgi:hypothetical protein